MTTADRRQPQGSTSQPWNRILRSLREAGGLTQDGLATWLCVGARTIQRWEQGATAPDLAAEAGLLAYCEARGLYRRHDGGSLSGLTPSPSWLRDLIASARLDTRKRKALPPTRPAQLAWPLTALVGRQRELTAITESVREGCLLTLTGAGGVGKTRLAQAAAAQLLPDFPDGVTSVALATITDAELVLPTIIRALGLSETAGSSPFAVLIASLRERHLLLLLDNLEQVLDSAVLIADLLTVCPSLKILATSRAPLRIGGEREYRVEPLEPADLNNLPPLDLLATVPAVQLFCERAHDVRQDFALTPQNAKTVAAICSRLDGLPLALELAAARLKLFDPETLLTRLDRSLDLLSGGRRDAPARQQRLRDTIAWSYELLKPADKALFRRLAVFVGGCSLEAAEAVAGELVPRGSLTSAPVRPDEPSTLDGIASLVDQSLLWREDRGEDEPRFRLGETVREFASERLEASGERAHFQERHAEFFLQLAVQADRFATTSERRRWHDRLEVDHDNLRAALSWSAGTGNAERDLRFTAAMFWFYEWRGHANEGRPRFEGALARHLERYGASPQPESIRAPLARTLCGAGSFAWLQGDPDAARQRLEQGLSLAQALGDAHVMALATEFLGLVAQYVCDQVTAQQWYRRTIALARESGERWFLADALTLLGDSLPAEQAADAEQYYLESLALYREGHDPWAAMPLTSLGRLALREGDYGKAEELIEEAVALRREDGSPLLIAIALASLGDVARCKADFDQARALFRESLGLSRTCGLRHTIAWSLCGLGSVAARCGNTEEALALFAEALPIAEELGQRTRVAACLVGLAGAAQLGGLHERAARLLGAAHALCDRLRAPLEPADQIDYQRYLDAVRGSLGQQRSHAEWSRGQGQPSV
jgi:predicted ATPase/transcriptional regulator with XRE-family HTH domain